MGTRIHLRNDLESRCRFIRTLREKATQVFLKSPKENKQLSPSGQKRSCETSEHEEDSFSASTKKPNVEKELEKHVFWQFRLLAF
jgi:hypothetical protein